MKSLPPLLRCFQLRLHLKLTSIVFVEAQLPAVQQNHFHSIRRGISADSIGVLRGLPDRADALNLGALIRSGLYNLENYNNKVSSEGHAVSGWDRVGSGSLISSIV